MERLDRAINGIYEAVETPELWQQAGAEIAELVDGHGIHLMLLGETWPHEQHINLYLRGDPEGAQEYLDHYAAQDFRFTRVQRNPRGVIVDERAYVTREEARQSPIHQELFPKYGTHNLAGANLSVGSHIGWFGISSRQADSYFEGRELAILERLAPHLHRAFAMTVSRNAMAEALESTRQALENTGVAVVRFNTTDVEFINGRAKALFTRGFLFVKASRLGCANTRADARLVAAFRQAVETGMPQRLLLTDPMTGDSYSLHLHACTPGKPGAVTVSLRLMPPSTQADMESIRAFCNGYGLAEAPTRIIAAILNDVPLANYAASRGVSLDTVRKQLKAAMAQMEFRSQKQLVRLFESFRATGG